MRIRTILFFILITFGSQAQNVTESYKPIRKFKVGTNEIKKVLQIGAESAKQREFASNAVKTDFLKAVKEFQKYFAQLDTEKLLMFNDTITTFLNQTTNRIIQFNPILQGKKIYVFTLRSDEVNAANYGPGIIAINLGLLAKTNTYEQLVFTLCHEIAHEYLDHCYKSIEQRCVEINSKEFKKKARKIKRAEYNSSKLTELLIASTLSKLMVQNRKQELEADSLGFILYSNLNLDKNEAIADIVMLDSAEVPYSKEELKFQQLLDPENKYFENEWLEIPKEKLSWNVDSSLWTIPDSLKTHPDCKERIKLLTTLSATYSENSMPSVTAYNQIQETARLELIEEFLINEDYANSLYFSLQLLSNSSTHKTYLHNAVVNSLCGMANALTEHRFSYVVDHPHELYYPTFNKTLHFLHQLNSSALKKLAVNYFNTNLKNIVNDSFTAYNAVLIKSWETPKDKYKELLTAYSDFFKDDHYLGLLESQLKIKKK